jgi:hypothetical protein
MFGIGRIPSEDSSKKSSGLSEDSSNSERYQPAVMDQSVQALQAQLAKIQRNLAARNKIIANLMANRHHIPQPNSCDNMAKYFMKKFIKSHITIFNEVNPQKPALAFHGLKWSEWEIKINCTLQHAFLSNKSFIGDKDLFSVMNLVQNKPLRRSCATCLIWLSFL